MDVEVYFGGFKPTQVVRQDVVDMLDDALRRYAKYVRCVSVNVTDVNGPKGGVDKQCRCVVHLKRMPSIVVQDSDASYGMLVNRVIDRVAFAVSERVDKLQTSFRTRRSLSAVAGSVVATEEIPGDAELEFSEDASFSTSAGV